MKSFPKHKRPLAKSLRFWDGSFAFGLSFLAFILLTVSLIRPAFHENVSTAALDLFMPVVKTVYMPFQTVADYITDISGIATLKAENARLTAENEKLKEWYQTALMLDAENKSLQSLLNFKVPSTYKFMTVQVLSDSDTTFSRTVLLNAGLRDDVEKNHIILGGEGILGRVIEAGEGYSRALLLNDVNSRVPVQIEGTNLKAIMKGMNGTAPVLEFLSEKSVIAPNARLMTSGDGGVFPAGLPVGQVRQDEGRYKVSLYSEIEDYDYVRVIQTNKTPFLILNTMPSQ